MRRKTISVIFLSILMMMVVSFGPTAFVSRVQAGGINATEVTLYAMDEKYKSKISIPKDCITEFQLVVSGEQISDCYVVEGDSCDVTETGLITPRYSQWSWGISANFGQSVIECIAGNSTYRVVVEVINYAAEYANGKIQEYLNDNIMPDMSDEEVLDTIAKYPASFDYSDKYSGATSMVIFGCGDCWASTDLIIRECKFLGIDAWGRTGRSTPGEETGHENAMVYLNGKYYEIEAGYSGKAPRHYYVMERESLYCWYPVSNDPREAVVFQFDGRRDIKNDLEIPSEIYGYTIVGISKNAIGASGIRSVSLPSTIRYLEDRAFYFCLDLETITIPASVKEIGSGVFVDDMGVKIKIDEDNPYFCVVSNVIYTKDMTKIIEAPNCETIRLPDTLKEMNTEAFYGNDYIKYIDVPSSVEIIGDRAFGATPRLESVVLHEGSLTTLGNDLFMYCDIEEITIPQCVTTIGSKTFYGSEHLMVHMKAKTAPTLPDDFELSQDDKVIFYVSKDAKGYDKGKWSELDVRIEGCDLTPTPTATPTPIVTPTPAPSPEPTFEDFVERLYTVALNRPSEKEGKEYWVNEIKTGNKTGADCGRFFLLSDEFNNRGLNLDDFVETLYKTFFGRDSESNGKAYWVGELKKGTKSRTDVINGFIDSTEWCNICAEYGVKSGAPTAKAEKASKNAINFATRLYTCCLGRAPEDGGLKYWSLALTNLEQTGCTAAKEFFTSEEFVNLKLKDDEYIKRLYTTFMDRVPEASEVAFWTGEISKGTQTRYSIMAFFGQSPEFTQICLKYGIDRGMI